MTCAKCKRETPPDALFCPYCGVSLKPKVRTHRPKTRPNGTGSAYKRGRTWTARVIVGWKLSPTGKSLPIARTKGGFATKKAALEHCLVLRQYKPKKAPPLIEYWETYSQGKLAKLSTSKQVAYNGAWKKLSALHYRPVDQITVSEVSSVVANAADTYYTRRDCKAVLIRLFELAGADGYCSKDIPTYIELPSLEEKERQTFTEDEQSALWNLYESGDMLAAIPLLMICTGMMPGEMMQLKVEHIDIPNQRIVGVGMKTKVRKASPVYLPEDILPLVEDLIAHALSSGYIWPHDKKKWYTLYYSALDAAGCRKLEPYCCRHTTATRLAITENIAPQTIKRLMRWSTSKMLDRYAHPDETDAIKAINTIKK